MPRYFFNLYNDIDVEDEEGAELADLPAAKEHAIADARQLMADHVMNGRPIKLHHRIEIVSGEGKALATVEFRDAITIEQ